MYQPQKVRQGWVKIHRRPGGKFSFTGVCVIGRDRKGGMANRILWPHHASPEWFKTLCDEYADTNFQVEIQVVKLFHTGIALVLPTALSKEQAVCDYQVRYGLLPNPTPEVPLKQPSDSQVPENAYSYAFQAHAHAATLLELEVLEDIRDGLKSYTKARERKSGKAFMIIGGMLVNKVVKGYKPEDPKWQQALRTFVRVKEDT